nr:restriction endonuclease subunit S [Rhizobium sp. BK619]
MKFANSPSRARKPVQSGDVIISTVRTYLKAVASIGPEAHNWIVSTGFAVLRPNSQILPGFLYRAVQSNPFVESVVAASTGVSYPAINPSALGSILIPIPDLPTQKSIADFLNRETARIDQLIQKKQGQLALFPEKEKAEISRLVLRGTDANIDTFPSGIVWRGAVPSHWTESRLKAHFKMRKRQGFEDRTVLSVYREFGVIEKSSRDDNINKTPEDLSKYQLVEPGDLVINKMKAWQGSLGVSTFTGITSPDYVVMVPIGEHDAGYMHHLLRARPMPTAYHLISNGIRIDQWRMEPEKFLSLPVFLPPLHEQRQIATSVNRVLKNLRDVSEAVSRSIDRLRELRSALITAAVTGQINVATWDKQGLTDRRLDKIEETLRA